MYTMTMCLAPPHPRAAAELDAVKSLVVACVRPTDHVEHVYIRSGSYGRFDSILFFSVNDLATAQVNGTAFSSRLLRDYLPGWSLAKVCFKPAV